MQSNTQYKQGRQRVLALALAAVTAMPAPWWRSA